MSLLSHNEISLLLDDGVVTKASYENINSASLDIQLGPVILSERTLGSKHIEGTLNRVVLRDRTKLNMIEFDMRRDGPYILGPGEFILAHSVEIFHLPRHISCKYSLKSSMARIGLEHLNAGWCDAGWNGSVLTLELKNMTRHHDIVLQPGDLIGQMIFFTHKEVPFSKSYAVKGNYNGDRSVSGAKIVNRDIVYGEVSDESYQEEYEREHPPMEGIIEEPRNVITSDED